LVRVQPGAVQPCPEGKLRLNRFRPHPSPPRERGAFPPPSTGEVRMGVFRTARTEPRHPAIPTIEITGYEGSKIRLRGLKTCEDRFIAIIARHL